MTYTELKVKTGVEKKSITVRELRELLAGIENQDAIVCIDLNTENSGSYSEFMVDSGDSDAGIVTLIPNDLQD